MGYRHWFNPGISTAPMLRVYTVSTRIMGIVSFSMVYLFSLLWSYPLKRSDMNKKPHILIAPNAFKHGLDAPQAAEVLARGFAQSRLDCTTTCFPIGDGGDGTCELIHTALNGRFVRHTVRDPLGRPIETGFSLVHGGRTAVIEMADVSGIRLLESDELNPMRTSSYGTGELIRHALDESVDEIVIGMGGSATVDGGCGILEALGVRFLDASGEELGSYPEALSHLHDFDLSQLDERLTSCRITILCDVDNLLLGSEGAAAVFGPQKGASETNVAQLDDFLSKVSSLALQKTGRSMAEVPRGGTAGGAAAGLFALAHANLVQGIDFFLEMTGFDRVLDTADWLVTGEGSLDSQTLGGKGPMGVARRAKSRNIPVIGLGGKLPLTPARPLLDAFDVLLPIGNGPAPLQQALADTEANLHRTAQAIGNLIASAHER